MDADLGGIPGVSVGHWTDPVARTGCTVVLFDRPVLAAVDVRGGAPATRETDLLAPGRLVQRVDAILLTGGSAFGLAAADGVVDLLARRGRGFPTVAGPVPIVPTAALYDLGVGEPIAPGPDAGRLACEAAGPVPPLEWGQVGAGTGATTGKIFASDRARRGGVGFGSVSWDGGTIATITAVNAYGDVAGHDATRAEPRRGRDPLDRRETILRIPNRPEPVIGTSTTLAVVIVNAPCSHDDLLRCAVSAHDGFARSIHPCHTPFDGDVVFAIGLIDGHATPGELLKICIGVELATERAILDAVTA